MQCEHCKTKLLSTNYAVIENRQYCLNCLSTNPSLFNNNESSSSINPTEQPIDRKISTKQCQACFEEKVKKDFKTDYSSRCLHTDRSICDGCLYQHVKQEFEKMCTDNVHCPESNCEIIFTYKTVRKILSTNKDSKLLEKYDQFIFQRQLEKMEEFIWCAHGCGMGQLNDGGHENNIVTCAKCHKKTCFIHKTKWHEGLTCSE
jgi:hypothetical protein